MNILHVDDDPLMRDLVALLIHKSFGIQTRQASSGNEAIGLLKLGEEYDLILSDFNMPEGTGGTLFTYLNERQIHIPFVLVSSDHPAQHEEFKDHHLDGYIIKPNVSTPLKSLVKQILHVDESTKSFLPNSFISVHAKTLLKIGEIPFDVYLKIGQHRHVRILKKGGVFGQELFEKYSRKQVESFFIQAQDSQNLLDCLISSLEILAEFTHSGSMIEDIHRIMDKVSDTELRQQLLTVSNAIQDLEKSSLPLHESIAISEATQMAAQRSLNKLGASLEVQTLIKASVKLTLDTLSKIPELQIPLQRLFSDKEKYQSAHCLILAQTACYLAIRLGWSSNLTRYKIGLAAFLHDITIANADLVKIQTLPELEQKKANFTKSEVENFYQHPNHAAELVRSFQQIPPDVHLIIEQHHEQPDGSGFPRGLSTPQLAPLSALFIISHDLTNFMMEQSSHIDAIEKFAQLRQKKYSQGLFKKILHALTTQKLPVRTHTKKAA